MKCVQELGQEIGGAVEETNFQQWVRKFGVNKLARAMSAAGQEYEVTFSAVYQWLRGEHEPRSPKIRKMVEISEGAISLEDVHAHFEQLRRQAAEAAT